VVVVVDCVEVVLVVVVPLWAGGLALVEVVVPCGPVGPVFAFGRGTLVVVVPLPQPARGTAIASARTHRPAGSLGPRKAERAFRVKPGYRPLMILRRGPAGAGRSTGNR
jgi:hypothetical protein